MSGQLPFMILDETAKLFPKFNVGRRSLLIKFNSPGEEEDPTTYIREYTTALTNFLVDDVPGFLCLRIGNTENV